MSAARRLEITLDSISSRLDELPSLPSIVYELSRVINDPMSSTAEVEALMSNDQGLTTKVLRLVNSAYYAIPGGVTSLSRAIGYIGFDTVNQLVLCSSILNALETKGGPSTFNFSEFWKHSIGVAIASETIGKFVRHPTPADLFTFGLVHDMGKVALYIVHPEVMVSIVEAAAKSRSTYGESENALEIPSHAAIGQVLAQRWQLPAPLQAVIKHHHTREPASRGLSTELNANVDIVFLANLLVHALKFGDSGYQKIQGAPTEVLERLTIDPNHDLKTLLQEIKAGLEKAQDFVRVLGEVA